MTVIPPDLLPRLQALLTLWDEQAASAARKLERSENPVAGGFYTGAMFGYEDCADGLAMLGSRSVQDLPYSRCYRIAAQYSIGFRKPAFRKRRFMFSANYLEVERGLKTG